MKKNTFSASVENRMKKTKRWLGWLSVWVLFFIGQTSFAQITYSQDFSADAASWTTTGGYLDNTGWTDVSYCTEAGAMRINVYTTGSQGTIVSPVIETSDGGEVTLSYSYKITDYNSDTATPANFGTAQIQYKVGTGNWITVQTIGVGGEAHLPANTCVTKTVSFMPPVGDLSIRYNFVYSSGDWEFYVDDVEIETTGEPPLCPTVTGLVVSNISAYSAEMSWDEMDGVEGYQYAITTSVTPPTSGDFTEDTYYEAINVLAPQTIHYLHVRTVCGDDDFGYWSTIQFTTPCIAITNFPFLETFDIDSTTKSCWTVIDGNEDGYMWDLEGVEMPNSGQSAEFYIGFEPSNDYLVTPQLILGSAPKRLKFWVRDSGFIPEPLDVKISTSGAEMTDFDTTLFSLAIGDITDEYTEYVIDLTDYVDTDVYIAFVNENSDYGYLLSIDDVRVEDIPTCPDQTGLAVSNISAYSAEMSWDEKDGIEGYEYAVTISATPPVSGDFTEETYYNTEDDGNILIPQTNYYLHVRTVCGDDDFGYWATTSFKTLCTAMTTLPYVENFDTYGVGSTAFPDCWSRPVTYTDYDVFPSIVDSPVVSSPNSLQFQSQVGLPTYAVSPAFVEDINNLRVKFQLKKEGDYSGNIEVGVMSNPFDISTFELVRTIEPDDDEYHGYTINLDETTLSGGNNYVALRHNSNSDYWYYWLDNFIVELIPECADVTGLVVSNISSSSVDVSWDEMDGVVGYEYAVTTSATPPAEADDSIEETFVEDISGLIDNTSYYLHVRTNCGDGDFGAWISISFKTAVAPATIPWNEGFATTTPAGWNPNNYTIAAAAAEIGYPSTAKFGDGTTNVIRRNPWSSSATSNFTTNSVGEVEAGNILSFDYKLVNYDDDNVPASGSGNFKIEISTDYGTSYTELETVINNGIEGWHSLTYPLDDYEGSYVKIKITDTWTSGDYYIGFDNFYIGQELSASVFDKSALRVYPNPTKNILNISYNQEISTVEIYNLVGQKVTATTVNANEGQVDMSNLSSGAYFVKITSSNISKTVKVIKE